MYSEYFKHMALLSRLETQPPLPLSILGQVIGTINSKARYLVAIHF